MTAFGKQTFGETVQHMYFFAAGCGVTTAFSDGITAGLVTFVGVWIVSSLVNIGYILLHRWAFPPQEPTP